jgi:hypothetical protein
MLSLVVIVRNVHLQHRGPPQQRREVGAEVLHHLDLVVVEPKGNRGGLGISTATQIFPAPLSPPALV